MFFKSEEVRVVADMDMHMWALSTNIVKSS